MGHRSCLPKKFMWLIILLCASFALQVIFDVMIRIRYEDSEKEDPETKIHVNSSLTRKLMWPRLIMSTLIFHPH